FTLKSAPKEQVEIQIASADGKTIRKLKTHAKAGLNRMAWDLHYESPRLVALRTAAPENPHIWNEPRFRDADSRPITHWGTRPAEVGPIVLPGDYSVKVKIDGQAYTQKLTIMPDPKSPGSEADLQASVKMLLQIREDISKVS